MPLKFKAKVEKSAWIKAIREKQRPVASAAVAALREVASEAVDEGRENIAAAGRFGPTWQQGLRRKIVHGTDHGEPSLQASAIIFHQLGIAGVFESGAVISGKPLLWIPTNPGDPPASRSGKKLVSATVRGQPVLFDANDHDRHRRPLYVGVQSVRIPKKWQIAEIVQKHAARIGELFIKHFKPNK
jgi:hypothetical protein